MEADSELDAETEAAADPGVSYVAVGAQAFVLTVFCLPVALVLYLWTALHNPAPGAALSPPSELESVLWVSPLTACVLSLAVFWLMVCFLWEFHRKHPR